MLCKAMWVFFNCLEICVYHMLHEWTLHLHNCSSSGSLTLHIRGGTHVLTTQTNLYKLQLFYSFTLMLYTYVSRPSTILIYLTVTYLCYHVSVSLCVITSMFPLLLCWLALSSRHILFPTYMGSVNADIIHQVILTCQVQVKFQWGFNIGEGKNHIRWADTWSWLLLDNTRMWGSNENI